MSNQKNDSAHDFAWPHFGIAVLPDSGEALFAILKFHVANIGTTQELAVQAKSRACQLRGTLRQFEQSTDFHPEQLAQYSGVTNGDDRFEHATRMAQYQKRRYDYEVARLEFMAAQEEFARALQVGGCFIREQGFQLPQPRQPGLHLSRSGSGPAFRTPEFERLYRHNLIIVEELFQRSHAVFTELNAKITELPVHADTFETVWAQAKAAREQFHRELWTMVAKPPRDIR